MVETGGLSNGTDPSVAPEPLPPGAADSGCESINRVLMSLHNELRFSTIFSSPSIQNVAKYVY